jgi:hypothetical protein
MARNPHLYRVLSMFVLLSAFLFASLPAQALPVHRPAPKVTALGEGMFAWVRNLLVSLGFSGMSKEGVMIDPDGAESPEGVSIDPDGRP